MKESRKPTLALALLLTLVCGIRAAAADSFDASVYAHRREALMQKFEGGIAILTQRVWGGQDFYYLTGFDEPEAICLLIPDGKVR